MTLRHSAAILSLALATATSAAVCAAAMAHAATVPDTRYWQCDTFSSCHSTPAAVGHEIAFGVPAGFGTAFVTLVGAPGQTVWRPAGPEIPGGAGAVVSGYLDGVAGRSLVFRIGSTGSGRTAGYNGGGVAGDAGAGAGGGATDVRIGTERLAVAAGGGGAGGAHLGGAGGVGGDADSRGGDSTCGDPGGNPGSGGAGGAGGRGNGHDSGAPGAAGDTSGGGSGGIGSIGDFDGRDGAGGGGGGGFGGGGGGSGSQNNCLGGAGGGGGGSRIPRDGATHSAVNGETPGVTITRADRIPPAGSTLVTLVQKASGKCATATIGDANGATNWFGLPVTLGSCLRANAMFNAQAGKQAFRMAHESGQPSDIYRFQNFASCQGCWGDAGWWDTAYAHPDNGTGVVLGNYAYWSNGDAGHQLWRVIPLNDDSGQVLIQQVSSGRYLDSAYGTTADGSHLAIGDRTASETQQWQIVTN
jgi:hypothetical protein